MGVPGLNERIHQRILAFVDETVPGPCACVWLAGSRAKGTATPTSDWDVIAFSEYAPEDRTRLFESNQTRELEPGLTVELVLAHPMFWDDEGRYMTDLRQFGVRLR